VGAQEDGERGEEEEGELRNRTRRMDNGLTVR
jgi:hypothetical protein